MDYAVSMTVVQRARYLPAKLPSLLLLQSSMRDDIIEHLAPVDVFKKHIPMVCSAHHISHCTYVRMIQKSNDSSFSCSANLFRMIGAFSISSALIMPIIGRASRNDLNSNLITLVIHDCNIAKALKEDVNIPV